MTPQEISGWVLVSNNEGAQVLEKFEPCKLWTANPVQKKESLAELVDHCTENTIFISDKKIQEIMDDAERRGDPIPPEVAPAFERYLKKAGIKKPSQATIDAVNNRLKNGHDPSKKVSK